MMHFVRTVFDVRADGVKLIAMEEVRNYGKIKNIVENGWLEDAYPLCYLPSHKLQKPINKSGIF